MPTVSSELYTLAAKAVAPILRLPFVESVYIRRSVAAGEAEFPWSDLDLGMVIGDCSGKDLYRLWRRFQLAKVLFPRLGECVIATAEELAEMAAMDPYRASLDRRFGIVASGGRPPIPELPISSLAASRRLVFWFEHYLPLAVRQNNLRNQRKFVKEMANALGVVEGRWTEPKRSRTETELPHDLPAALPFAQCCYLAERAQRQLRPPAPALESIVRLPSLVLLPSASTPIPEGLTAGAIVATPPVLDLLMATQNPFLWPLHRAALESLGFLPPPVSAWWDVCYRQSSGERFRLPGFCEPGPVLQGSRLARIEGTVRRLLAGQIMGEDPGQPVVEPTKEMRRYYEMEFDGLARRAELLRAQISPFLPSTPLPARPGPSGTPSG